MQGEIVTGSVPRLIRQLISSRQSGLLYLQSQSRDKGIYFDTGAIAQAQSSQPGELLQDVLAELGLVPSERLQATVEALEAGQELGEQLLSQSALSSEQLAAARASLLKRIVASVFEWSDGQYSFYEGSSPYSRFDTPLPTPRLLVECVLEMQQFEALQALLLADERPLERSSSPDHADRRLGLDGDAAALVGRVDGSASAGQLCSRSGVAEERAARIVYGLMLAGVVKPARASRTAGAGHTGPSTASQTIPSQDWSGATSTAEDTRRRPRTTSGERTSVPRRPTAGSAGHSDEQKARIEDIEQRFEQLEGLNHYAVLGLRRDASKSEVQQAFQRLSSLYHPNNNPSIQDDTLKQKLVFVYGKIAAAHRTLADDASRAAYDHELQSLQRERGADYSIRLEFSKSDTQRAQAELNANANAHYEKAKRLKKLKNYHDALEAAKQALELRPNDAAYHALAGSIYALNPNMRWQKEAESHYRKAQELDPWKAAYPLGLAQLYREAGLRLKAKRAWFRVLELDPNNEEALAELPPAERPKARVKPPPGVTPSDDEEPEVEVD